MLSPARLVVCLLGLALLPFSLASQGELLVGPMLGYQTHREVAITLTTRDAAEVRLDYWISDRPETRRSLTHVDPWISPAGGQPQQFVLPALEMGATYDYAIFIDGEPAERPYPLTFRTQDQWEWRRPPPAFSFLFGSCAYLNDPPYDRPGRPYGAGTTIFRHMADSGAEFMVWGGDNLYLRESDWSSASGIWYRFQKDFSIPDLQPLFARLHHYAIWDDHDFGPNNSNRAYELKHVALAAFTTHFANRTWGEPDNPGVYGKFQYGDAAFFLLDNRYHRDESEIDQDRHPDKSMYGRRQVEWLLNNLASMHEGNNRRHSPIRFIVTGGQFTSDRTYPGAEGNHRYARERAEIIDFIRHHRIPGVIILSGDVHYTELTRRDDLLDYPLYELTSSPLSSGAHSRPLGDDPHRIPGTAVQTQNYCQIAITGPTHDRVVTITCHGADGAVLWTHAIPVNDLQMP